MIRSIRRYESDPNGASGGKMLIGILGLLAAQSATPPPPTATAGEAIQPSSKWIADFAPDRCVLSRQFGSGNQQVTLALRPLADESQILLILFRSSRGARRAGGTGRVTLSPTGASASAPWVAGAVKAPPYDEYDELLLPMKALGDLSKAEEMQVDARELHLRLALPAMQAAIATLDRCNAELLKSWGFDRDVLHSLSRPLKFDGDPAQWITPDVFPAEALRNGYSGSYYFRLSVSEQGNVTECHVFGAPHSELFERPVCAALTGRARFQPALDKDGKPVRALFMSRVNFFTP